MKVYTNFPSGLTTRYCRRVLGWHWRTERRKAASRSNREYVDVTVNCSAAATRLGRNSQQEPARRFARNFRHRGVRRRKVEWAARYPAEYSTRGVREGRRSYLPRQSVNVQSFSIGFQLRRDDAPRRSRSDQTQKPVIRVNRESRDPCRSSDEQHRSVRIRDHRREATTHYVTRIRHRRQIAGCRIDRPPVEGTRSETACRDTACSQLRFHHRRLNQSGKTGDTKLETGANVCEFATFNPSTAICGTLSSIK